MHELRRSSEGSIVRTTLTVCVRACVRQSIFLIHNFAKAVAYSISSFRFPIVDGDFKVHKGPLVRERKEVQAVDPLIQDQEENVFSF